MLHSFQVSKTLALTGAMLFRALLLTVALLAPFTLEARSLDLAPTNPTSDRTSENTNSLLFAPLGNVGFDRYIVGPATLFQMFPVENSSLTIFGDANDFTGNFEDAPSDPYATITGGFAERLICASNYFKQKLTCEVDLSPNGQGLFPNLFTLVLTEGRDPNLPSSTGQFAEIVFDMTDEKGVIVSAYVYSTSTNLYSWQSSAPGSPLAAPIVSTAQASPPSFVKEFTRSVTKRGYPRISFSLETTPILNYDPTWNVPNLPIPSSWLGVGFGNIHSGQLTTYVKAKVAYSLAFNPLNGAEQFGSAPGFIKNFSAEGKTTIPLPAMESCSNCTSLKTSFLRPSFWRSFHGILSNTQIAVPCSSTPLYTGSKDLTKWLEADPFSASYVAAQLSVYAKYKRERYFEAVRASFGVYGEPLMDGDIIRFNQDDVLTPSSKLSDLFYIAQKEAARCEPVLASNPNGPKKKTITPTSEKLAQFFQKLETVSTSSTASAISAAEELTAQLERASQMQRATKQQKKVATKKKQKNVPKKATKKSR
jgi:hypothetical protein